MYFSMDEIGIENSEKIKTICSESDRWEFIFNVAETYGFEGIHITPSLYKTFNLDLRKIPDYFSKLKLTFHFGGIYRVVLENDYENLCANFSECFEIAVKHNMHDISIHPPFINKLTLKEKEVSLKYLCRFMDKWLKTAIKEGISLSLESHVSGEFFQFNGLGEYTKFVNAYPELGVLIDIAHNYYDGYSEDEIIQLLPNINVKGMHVSDAIHGVVFDEAELRNRTHLAVGTGGIDFPKILNAFNQIPNIYSVLEIKSNNEGLAKSLDVLIGISKG